MSRYYRSFLEESGSSYTPRTTAFATATAITDTTILNALNTFDLGLISNGLDTKMKAVYPFVGSTATTQKFNFMDARDLDVAFRLSFNGGWTHSANGIQGNATNTYANTFLSPYGTLGLNSSHFSIYSRTNIPNSLMFDMCTNFAQTFSLATSFSANTTWFQINQNFDYSKLTDTDSLGFRLISRLSSTQEKLYKNNSLLGTVSVSSASQAGTIEIGRYIGGGYYSSKQYSFSSIGNGLTDSEETIFYNLVQAMQTTLSRQV